MTKEAETRRRPRDAAKTPGRAREETRDDSKRARCGGPPRGGGGEDPGGVARAATPRARRRADRIEMEGEGTYMSTRRMREVTKRWYTRRSCSRSRRVARTGPKPARSRRAHFAAASPASSPSCVRLQRNHLWKLYPCGDVARGRMGVRGAVVVNAEVRGSARRRAGAGDGDGRSTTRGSGSGSGSGATGAPARFRSRCDTRGGCSSAAAPATRTA